MILQGRVAFNVLNELLEEVFRFFLGGFLVSSEGVLVVKHFYVCIYAISSVIRSLFNSLLSTDHIILLLILILVLLLLPIPISTLILILFFIVLHHLLMLIFTRYFLALEQPRLLFLLILLEVIVNFFFSPFQLAVSSLLFVSRYIWFLHTGWFPLSTGSSFPFLFTVKVMRFIIFLISSMVSLLN